MKKISGWQLTNQSERRNEMKTSKICKRSFIMAIALAAVFTLAAVWPYTASVACSTECGLIGTWYGNAGSTMKWLGVHTAGSTDIQGEMLLNWVRVKDSLLTVDNTYPTVTRITDGHGVWQQTARGHYKYTWYAYGIDTTANQPVYSIRVSGLAKNTNCNYVDINFKYEIFDGLVLPQDMSGVTPIATITDSAAETRVPLVVTP